THIGMADQSCLDLSQLDPVSTNLHLEVVTPQKLDLAIRHPPAQITCLVHPTTRFTAKGVRKKSLGRQPGPIEITSRHSVPSDINLSRHSHRRHFKFLT